MEIILIRHAKAESRKLGLEDIERHLTEKGRKKYRALVPQLGEKLAPIDERHIIMWSSPANRARETAEIVTNELQIEVDAIKDFIYTGEFAQLSAELQHLDDDVTLLLVGHEPHLSNWSRQLSGEEFTLKKGAMISFKVASRTPLKADLQWQIQPKSID